MDARFSPRLGHPSPNTGARVDDSGPLYKAPSCRQFKALGLLRPAGSRRAQHPLLAERV